MEFDNWRTLSAFLIPDNAVIPGLKLANAFGVNGQTLWLLRCVSVDN
jgi:hypothetical protein